MTEPRTPLSDDLERARRDALPVMALRRHPDGSMDDVVCDDVERFRAEQLDDDCLWLACYFRNGERVTFNVCAERQRGRRPALLVYDVGEMPERWVDWDRRQRGELPVERDGEDRA
jgi:hypothetical protein